MLFKARKFKIGVLKPKKINQINFDLIILRNISYLKVTDFSIINEETEEYHNLISFYKNNSPHYYNHMPCLIFKNNSMQRSVSKSFMVGPNWFLDCKRWEATDTPSIIKDKQLPVDLIIRWHNPELANLSRTYEAIKDFNIISFTCHEVNYSLNSDQIKYFAFLALRNKGNI